METTYTAYEKKNYFQQHYNKYSCTRMTFDNYNHFVKILYGKDTLHGTIGIIYQFTNNSEETETSDITCDTEVN